MEYVVCILFDAPMQCVALITKNRPEWQRGLLNGPGGHMKDGETPAQAASREFEEETGVQIKVEAWRPFATLQTKQHDTVHFLTCTRNANLKTTTDEQVRWYNLEGIWQRDLPVIPNLRWLIPMAMDPGYGVAGLWET